MIGVIGGLLSSLLGIGEKYVERRAKREEMKLRIEQAETEARIARAQAAAKAEFDYDNEALRQQRYSWRDEYLVILWSFPYVVAFFPVLLLALKMPFSSDVDSADVHLSLDNAWKVLASAPEWWWLSWIGIVAATFGLRWLWRGRVKR